RHAIMHMTPEKKFIVQNLGTKNGVYVNSTRHEQTELLDGDLIELGEVRLRFVINPVARA
ncbi:MAG: FHA domain-containing protein, partial [Hyphomicrobiaceae bacterium]